ncbi:hypothetical protein G5714_021050 [Onychostoma macrolepis]|uniref:Uncharacterized protein n=1 Tax=Onychostoma macrolepis TaxID=369639 RepID=A0A7J6BVL8_9TELE|nr:hypothetical protein G5714_021050 [Onychostoma macrolepis]
MSFHEEREDEDILSEASSLSDESTYNLPPTISDATATFDPCISRRKRLRSESPGPSCVSVKSNRSMQIQPPKFSDGPVTSDPL